MRVETHLHIRRFLRGDSDCISVRPLPDGKVHYSGTIALKDVTFAVQEAGRQKFVNEGVKNVHAFVRGEPFGEITEQRMPVTGYWRSCRYNPSNCTSFVDSQTGDVITKADYALLVGNKVFYFNP